MRQRSSPLPQPLPGRPPTPTHLHRAQLLDSALAAQHPLELMAAGRRERRVAGACSFASCNSRLAERRMLPTRLPSSCPIHPAKPWRPACWAARCHLTYR